MDEQLITVEGHAVRYYEAGEPHRRAILLLHGGFGDAKANWTDTMRHFQEDYYLIAPDLPGFGKSDPLPQMHIQALVDWAKNFLQALGLDQAAVIGHSFGGLIGRFMGALHPTLVPMLVIVDGGIIPSVPGAAKAISNIPGVGSFLYKQFSRTSASDDSLDKAIANKAILTDAFQQSVQSNLNGLAGLMRGLAVSPVPDKKIPRISVLIIWGEEDGLTPISTSSVIHKNIAGSQFAAIAECGHMPHLEANDVFYWQVERFFKSN